MSEEKQGDIDGSDMVLGLLSEAPSEPFVLTKRLGDGTTKQIPLRMQLLRPEEELQCLALAQKTAESYGEKAKGGHVDIYKESQAHELIAKALRHATQTTLPNGDRVYRQVFVDGGHLRKGFTSNEMALCLNAYEVTKAKFSCVESFDPEEMDVWAARLAEPLLGDFFLRRLDFSHWPQLMTALALEVQALRAEVSRPLSSLLVRSESEQTASDAGTGGSGESAGASMSDPSGKPLPIPSDRLVSTDEAAAIAKLLKK